MTIARSVQRPSGRLPWLIARLPGDGFGVLGCVSTEERSLAAVQILVDQARASAVELIDIREPDDHPGRAQIAQRKRSRREMLSAFAPEARVSELELLGPHQNIITWCNQRIRLLGPRVLLDVTALPKRFYFPLLKVMMRSEEVEDLIVSYTSPASYAPDNLHEDSSPPRYLPLFSAADYEEGEKAVLLVGLGFDSPGLHQIIESDGSDSVEVLFPMPAPPPLAARNWDFLRDARNTTGQRAFDVSGVGANHLSGAYDAFRASLAADDRRLIFAPYGPTPMSVAMALFCIAQGDARSSALYTQPRHYNPYYSTGVGMDRDGPQVYGYAVKLGGKSLYV